MMQIKYNALLYLKQWNIDEEREREIEREREKGKQCLDVFYYSLFILNNLLFQFFKSQ